MQGMIILLIAMLFLNSSTLLASPNTNDCNNYPRKFSYSFSESPITSIDINEYSTTQGDSLNVRVISNLLYDISDACALGIDISDSIAYIADSNLGLIIISISNPYNPFELSRFQTDSYPLNVKVLGSIAYVADSYDGLEIISIADPTNPTLVGSYEECNAWDVTIFNEHAFVVEYSPPNIHIISVSDPANPILKSRYSPHFWGYPYTLSIHQGNAFIGLSDAGGNGAMEVASFIDSDSLEYVTYLYTDGVCREIELSNSHAFIANDINGFSIFDISDPLNPVYGIVIGTDPKAVYTQQVYEHF